MQNKNQEQILEVLGEIRDLQSDEFLAKIPAHSTFYKKGCVPLAFILTCSACPEQYDVQSLNDGTQLAYIRFRMGKLRVLCPDVAGKVVLEKIFPESFQGCFYSEQERQQNLLESAKAIWKYYEKQYLNK